MNGFWKTGVLAAVLMALSWPIAFFMHRMEQAGMDKDDFSLFLTLLVLVAAVVHGVHASGRTR